MQFLHRISQMSGLISDNIWSSGMAEAKANGETRASLKRAEVNIRCAN